MQNTGSHTDTREVAIGSVVIGGGQPIVVQSMAATKTQDLDATAEQIAMLEEAGAGLIRVAVDSKKDVEALRSLRQSTSANLVVDLQENYRLAEKVAPFVQKLRYNPGHLHHHQREVAVKDKVKFLVDQAGENDCALRIGVNYGSLDPSLKAQDENPMEVALRSADEHISYMEELNFTRFVVSLKSSDPNAVIQINKLFHVRHPKVPIHLGVTEAGMLPLGEIKSRIAFENLIPFGIGNTIRVSLTLPFKEKYREIEVGKKILADISEGRFRSVPRFEHAGLNIISCPSCSRVENEAFIELAQKIREVTDFASQEDITIAVMGCRVNGPGETDEADIGLWCAPNHVNLKKGTELVGAFGYDEVIPRVLQEIECMIEERSASKS
jgi:(E)-4-hydroxy-3-methylbut-2-enyl-diphosphate synthase